MSVTADQKDPILHKVHFSLLYTLNTKFPKYNLLNDVSTAVHNVYPISVADPSSVSTYMYTVQYTAN